MFLLPRRSFPSLLQFSIRSLPPGAASKKKKHIDSRLTVGFFAMLIGFEFQPRPVRDLVCEDGEDEDFADRAGEGFVELSLEFSLRFSKRRMLNDLIASLFDSLLLSQIA